MKLDLEVGALYVTPNDVLCRTHSGITLRASAELITIFKESRVLAANGSGAEWSIILDSSEQIEEIAEVTGCELR